MRGRRPARGPNTLAGAAIAAALVLLPGVALAQSASKEADRLFREGRKLAESHDYASACPKFAQSEKLDPAPGTLLNLADCEERTGHFVSAAEHYRLAGSGFGKKDKRRNFAARKAAALDKRIAHLTLRLAAGAPDGTVVRLGDEIVEGAKLGVAAPADPGDVVVVVTAPGHQEKRYPVKLEDGGKVDLTVQPGDVVVAPVASSSPPASPGGPPWTAEKPPAHGSSSLRTAGFVVGGVGVAGLALGAVTGILSVDKASTVRAHCNTTTYDCDPEGLDAAQAGQVLSPLSTVGFIAGGVLAATGVVLVILGGKGHKSTSASWVPLVGPTFAGAGLVGRF